LEGQIGIGGESVLGNTLGRDWLSVEESDSLFLSHLNDLIKRNDKEKK
jgi:hypothetical protein